MHVLERTHILPIPELCVPNLTEKIEKSLSNTVLQKRELENLVKFGNPQVHAQSYCLFLR